MDGWGGKLLAAVETVSEARRPRPLSGGTPSALRDSQSRRTAARSGPPRSRPSPRHPARAQAAALGLGLDRGAFTEALKMGPHLVAPTGAELRPLSGPNPAPLRLFISHPLA